MFMSYIQRELIVLIILCITGSYLHAQATEKRDYVWCLANFQKLHPEVKLKTDAPGSPAGNVLAAPASTSYEALRQRFLEHHPVLQSLPQGANATLQTASVEQRSYAWCVQHLLPNVQQLQKPRPGKTKRTGRLQL